jgi:predicted nucleic acid-binding protein
MGTGEFMYETGRAHGRVPSHRKLTDKNREAHGPRTHRRDEHHWDVLEATAQADVRVGSIAHDARVAAICIEHGISELWTADRDF